MKQEQIENIKKEIFENWKSHNNFIGISRNRLESFSKMKNWKVRKVIAIARKNKEIYLEKRYYFFNLNKK